MKRFTTTLTGPLAIALTATALAILSPQRAAGAALSELKRAAGREGAAVVLVPAVVAARTAGGAELPLSAGLKSSVTGEELRHLLKLAEAAVRQHGEEAKRSKGEDGNELEVSGRRGWRGAHVGGEAPGVDVPVDRIYQFSVRFRITYSGSVIVMGLSLRSFDIVRPFARKFHYAVSPATGEIDYSLSSLNSVSDHGQKILRETVGFWNSVAADEILGWAR